MITSSASWVASAVIFITWDEDDGSEGNRVLTLVLRPDVKHRVSSAPYDHYSLLATIEDILGVPRLANARHARPMTDLAG
jgi:phosphatidylinositol-3-phosphatase